MTRLFLVLFAALTWGCGEGSSPVAPSTEQVAGVWMGHVTLRAASGGECVGGSLQRAIGSRDIFAAHIQQASQNLTSTLGYQGNQTSCSMAGTVRGTEVTLGLQSCQADRVRGFRCGDGAQRDLKLVGETMTAHAGSGTGIGTATSTWTVFAADTTTPVGTLTLSTDFVWNMLGIPHSDFHVFDGSVLPGYVDGVVVIPAEVNPFCDKCGWF